MAPDFRVQLCRGLAGSVPTIGAIIRVTGSILAGSSLSYGHGTANPDDEAYALVFDLLDLDYLDSEQLWNSRIDDAWLDRVALALQQRIEERRPLPYITGRAWFAGLAFDCDDRALVPRSPIAELIESGFLPWYQGPGDCRILDLCTGGGCIGIAAAIHMPGSRVDLADISPDALALARQNLEKHQVSDRVRLIQSDLFDSIEYDHYDIIVSNPPYVPPSSMEVLPAEYHHEPRQGLEAGDEGLQFVDKILKESGNYLNDNGILITEVGEIQAVVEQRYNQLPLTWLEFDRGGEGVFLVDKAGLPGQ